MMSVEVTVTIIASVIAMGMLVLASHRVERTKGKILKYHLFYVVLALSAVFLVPGEANAALFSPLSVVIVAAVFPIFESIRAVCTPDSEDDKNWLCYWIAWSIMSYCTEWVDDLAKRNADVRAHFYDFEFVFFLWMMLPYTDGATLIFEHVTEPLLAPLVKPIVTRMKSWISALVQTFVSVSHMWVLWLVFALLPTGLKRFVAVSIGTIYPAMASIVAATTATHDDDAYWLTFWSCYGSLYVIMLFLEIWIGRVPGFYTLVILCTVYLMVPVFNGATKVFRNILVPLARQQEMLILRDSLKLKQELMRQLPKDRADRLRRAVAASFGKDDDDAGDEEDPLLSYSYGSILRIPGVAIRR